VSDEIINQPFDDLEELCKTCNGSGFVEKQYARGNGTFDAQCKDCNCNGVVLSARGSAFFEMLERYFSFGNAASLGAGIITRINR
jgi:Tryptophan RNA-binding attenuator protein inhibitory protein